MRIIAGEFRGRKLDAPRGDGTRPTTDRVRESLMSALVSLRDGLDGAVVLDAFAGSGALSLEALSRGADTAMLCERDRDAAAVIERNIAALRLGRDRARLVRGDVLKRGAAAPGRPFDLIFLDPPYATDPAEVFGLLSRLDAADALAADLIVSYEHDASTTMPWRRWPKRPDTKQPPAATSATPPSIFWSVCARNEGGIP